MWAIKVLKGPQVGQIIPLKNGEIILGRAPTCQIQLQSNGISKEHARLSVAPNAISVIDLNSRNGTFVNGVKIRNRPLKKGDRVSLHDIIIEILDETSVLNQSPVAITHAADQGHGYNPPAIMGGGNTGLIPHGGSTGITPGGTMVSPLGAGGPNGPATPEPKSFIDVARRYFETVVLPGVYRLAENFEFQWVLGGFVFAYVILVTTLSVIPMAQISRTSIEKESQRRALTIAQGLHDRYLMALTNGTSGSFDTRFAEKEEGVKAAFILSASDGSILAPVTRAGAYANEPFVHSARRRDTTSIEQLDSETVGVSVPVEMYDPDTGLRSPKAFAMVLYNMGSLAVDNGRVVSLFVQVLVIAGIIGSLLFVFLYRLVEIPLLRLNYDIDKALREGTEKIESPYRLAAIQRLILNINSLLSRSAQSGPASQGTGKDIYSEALQLVRIMSNPALALDSNGSIIAINGTMANALGVSLTSLDNSNFNMIPDDALTTIIPELLDKANAQGSGFISSSIHFKGEDLELNLQPVNGIRGADYFIVTVTHSSVEEGAA